MILALGSEQPIGEMQQPPAEMARLQAGHMAGRGQGGGRVLQTGGEEAHVPPPPHP